MTIWVVEAIHKLNFFVNKNTKNRLRTQGKHREFCLDDMKYVAKFISQVAYLLGVQK